ncbi:hypothetical protein, partial [Fictibacillus sp. NRS-1165]|uniref:hypothetical protein n=1 Tax=Fictibacillus sp. NRS-1165 TaxID=3144463 RepID=UPI003D25C05C
VITGLDRFDQIRIFNLIKWFFYDERTNELFLPFNNGDHTILIVFLRWEKDKFLKRSGAFLLEGEVLLKTRTDSHKHPGAYLL